MSGDWLNRNGIHDLHSFVETRERDGKRHGKHGLRSVMEKRNILCLLICLDT